MPSATIGQPVRRLLAVVALLVVAGCTPTSTTAALRSAQPDYAPGWNGVAVTEQPQMPRAQFTGTHGKPFDLRAAMRARPTLVYFGYTHCPDICPVHLANIAQALRNTSLSTEQLNVVFVTADPARDTPRVLADYLADFDDSFIGLWAPGDEVDRVLVALGLPKVAIEPGTASQEYTVGHPGQVLAFDTTGRLRLAYPFGTRQSQWTQDLPKLAREDWP